MFSSKRAKEKVGGVIEEGERKTVSCSMEQQWCKLKRENDRTKAKTDEEEGGKQSVGMKTEPS